MNFSMGQWVAVVIIDLLARVTYTIVASLNILLIPIIIKYSAMHLPFIIVISVLLNAAKVPYAPLVSIVLANLIFAGLFAYSWISAIQRGHMTACVYESCYRVNGTITEAGVRSLVRDAVVQIAINVMAVGVVWMVGRAGQAKLQH